MLLPEIGDCLDGRYKLLISLGRGGFAGVFLAEDLQTDSKVVLKFPDISQLGDPAVYERFKRELAIGKLLDHPDLPVALAYSEGSPPYLVLKYVEGEPLTKVLREKGRFPVDQARYMVANLLEALQHCHEQGVYHRDLKPENLLLSTDGHLKILDFGIALMEGGPRVTWRGFSGLMGTPEYMAPEQIKGERGGAKSDIYAVGCLFYNLLAGKPPFTGDNPLSIMHQHLTAEPRPLGEFVPQIDPGILAAIRRAMRRRKEERYPTAQDMADDLRHPEEADLSWLDKPDPPLVAVLTDRRTPWFTIGAAIAAGIILALLFAYFSFFRGK
ncbi:Protein kinase domain protein [Acididesulfobacillus acetoxydans]|uniref:non-specific serine/threonine protein kinase n=1 Tax=Acididesulfobacillus acetoxydans TaxID=1561005 RepID=A0A8S0XXF4_9FIRM|nr:serine/threonine-protein kinase [Acididesulfobacillus acetoxydans]CAA7601687.1 Protein kinase domain protein [Acididesulfobacillus acetoxydans]CEJ09094.1 Serine/threonine-protein kinase PknB [Acididesulfobacillus acetoxydans]